MSTIEGTIVPAEVWQIAKLKHPHNGDLSTGYAHGFAEASQAFEASIASGEILAWQPIETAPRDGSEFMAWVIVDPTIRGLWEPRCYMDSEGSIFYFGRVDYDVDGWERNPNLIATHWMPQPEAPAVPRG